MVALSALEPVLGRMDSLADPTRLRLLGLLERHELGVADFPYDTRTWYRLRVENDGPKIRAYVDGKLLISAENDEIASGKVGVIAACPARP